MYFRSYGTDRHYLHLVLPLSRGCGHAEQFADIKYLSFEDGNKNSFTQINLEEVRMDRAPLPATVEIDMGPEPTSQALDADTPETDLDRMAR